MIRIEDLHKRFGQNEVLRGIALEVRRGETVALIGRSGCGKSVLLKHVAGLMRPDQGRVFLNGEDIHALRGKALQEVRARLGFLFQGGALFDSMTVFENVAFPLREKTSMGEEEIRARVLRELDHVGLGGTGERYPSQISGGMVKRAALARALVMDPEIMLFDEPTTGLDPIMGRAILDLIRSTHERLGFTGILVTHEIPRAFGIVDRVAMVHEGRILFSGTSEAFFASEIPEVKEFLERSLEGPGKCLPGQDEGVAERPGEGSGV